MINRSQVKINRVGYNLIYFQESQRNALINNIIANSGQIWGMRFPQNEQTLRDSAAQSELAWKELTKVAQKKVEQIKKEDEQKLEYSRNEMMKIKREIVSYQIMFLSLHRID